MTIHFRSMTDTSGKVLVEDSPFARFLFQSATSWFWLLVRLWVGYQWLAAGWEKFQARPGWALVARVSWVSGQNALGTTIRQPGDRVRLVSRVH